MEKPLREHEVRLNEKFQFVRGTRDSTLVMDKRGFVYRREGQETKTGEMRWGCQKRTSFHCRAKVIVFGDRIIFQRYEHNHSVE